MKTAKRISALSAALVLGAVLLLSSAGPAFASRPSPWVSVGQTVLVGTNTAGKVSGTPFVFTQIVANGSGPVTVKVPMSASGFRNLSSLRTPPITNGKAIWNLHLSGQHTERTVAHFPAARLPLQVSATYEFNGKKTKPQDILGQTGHLKVTYSIKNITTKATTVTFKNVFGETETHTVQAPVPMAAAFAVTFPATFTNLKAPGGSLTGNGNGTTGGSWTLFLFNPLGGVHQSVSYQAQVTNAAIPSATLSAQALPPGSLKTLPTIGEPEAPAVPTVTIGGRLVTLQVALMKLVHQIAVKASTVLSELKAVLVPAAQDVSKGAAAVSRGAAAVSSGVGHVSSGVAHVSSGVAKVATLLGTLSVGASNLSAVAGDVSARLAKRAAEASTIASMVTDVRARLTALPAAICGALGRIIKVPPTCESTVAATPTYTLLHSRVTALETFVLGQEAGLVAASGRAKTLQALAVSTSANLTARSIRTKALSARIAALSPQIAALSPKFTGLSAKAAAVAANAAQVAGALATALTPAPRHRHGKTIHTRQLGGGALIDAAVGKLDAAISSAGTMVDNSYAYLTALDTQAAHNQLPAGNASGATVQTEAFVYSLPSVNWNAQHTLYATWAGAIAIALGSTLGLALYRKRRGEASSLFPAKAEKPAHGHEHA